MPEKDDLDEEDRRSFWQHVVLFFLRIILFVPSLVDQIRYAYMDLKLPYLLLGDRISFGRRILFAPIAVGKGLYNMYRDDPALFLDRVDANPPAALFSFPFIGIEDKTQKRYVQQNAAIMFVDLEKSTIYKRLLTDADGWWIARIVRFHQVTKAIVSATGGRFSKNIGDEILAYYVGKDACLRAFRAVAAIEYWIQLKNAQIENREYDLSDWMAYHISLDYGSVWMLYPNDPFGSVVDRAARLVSKSGHNEIVASDDFITHIGKLSEEWTVSFTDCTNTYGAIKEFPDMRFFRVDSPE